MRVVLDTNVLVSAMLSPASIPGQVLKLWKRQVIEIIVSEEILEEYKKVLLYKKIWRIHKLLEKEVDEIINGFRLYATIVCPEMKPRIVIEDSEDDKFIWCAMAGEAGYIISGDLHLLTIGKYRGIQVIQPKTLLAIIDKSGTL